MPIKWWVMGGWGVDQLVECLLIMRSTPTTTLKLRCVIHTHSLGAGGENLMFKVILGYTKLGASLGYLRPSLKTDGG